MALFQSDTLSHWLYTNAPAAWISALIAVVTLLFVLRSRKKPRRIVVREVRNSSVITIDESIRKRVIAKFDDRPVRSLAQVEMEVFNEGSEEIQRPTVTLRFPDGCNLLNASMTPYQPDTHIKFTDHRTIDISLAYLNSVGQHKHVMVLSVLADGETMPINIAGSGVGWSVRHTTLSASKFSPSGVTRWMSSILVVTGGLIVAVKESEATWLLWPALAIVGVALLWLGYIDKKQQR